MIRMEQEKVKQNQLIREIGEKEKVIKMKKAEAEVIKESYKKTTF